MCGVIGIACSGRSLEAVSADRFRDAVAALKHRGPDGCGTYRDTGILFGHTRLSILDLSESGSQPMRTPDGRFAITYNGEVYNFRELARKHCLDGLRSRSDTEVVLALFAKLGIDALPELNGMFAFAIYDALQRKVWLVRDRLGIKPLYYRLHRNCLIFGSEIKSLNALFPEPLECDFEALQEWLYYGNALGGKTLFRGIQQLAPGHCLELHLDSFASTVRPYWSLERQASLRARVGRRQAVVETRRLLEEAVRRQLVSDVPVGVFLSGGVDSSAVAGFAARHYGKRLTTYSVGFDFSRDDGELPRARRVAAGYGTDHHEMHIAGQSVADLVEKLVHQHDMPFSDAANLPLYLMASHISATTKVVLQGDGGDELFGGYRRYSTLRHRTVLHAAARVLSHFRGLGPDIALSHRVQRYLNAFAPSDLMENIALLLTSEDPSLVPGAIFRDPIRRRMVPFDPFRCHRACRDPAGTQDVVNQLSLVDLQVTLPDTFLEKVDRATMAAGVEVRVPFLDNDLVDFVIGLPGDVKMPHGRRKWLLKKALAGVVPDEVLKGRKKGLEVPYGKWLQGVLKPIFFDHLAKFSKRCPEVLDIGRIETLFARTGSGRRDDSFMLWKVLNFVIWANQSRVDFSG